MGVDERWVPSVRPPSGPLRRVRGHIGAVSLSGLLYTVQSITYLATTAKFLFCFVCLFRE